MRIVFHIARANWYRVLSPVIDEALKRRHDVECWHHAGNTLLKDNTPTLDKVPKFKWGTPRVREYHTPEGLLDFVKDGAADAIVDVMPPSKILLDYWGGSRVRPKWVLHVAADSLYVVKTEEEMLACDLFAVRTAYELRTVIGDRTSRKPDALLKLKKGKRAYGRWFCDYYREIWERPWTSTMVAYLTQHVAVVGTPSLDVLPDINTVEVRRRWGIADGRPVVGFLPSAYGSAFGAYWEHLFMRRPWCRRAVVAIKNGRPMDAFLIPGDKEVVGGIRKLCDRHGAVLVTKLRHSTTARSYVSRASDVIVSDDSYYPHTAVELYASSDLVIGYYSTGSVESVAAGTRYIDVRIPYLPSEIFEETSMLYRGMFNSNGSTQIVSAKAAASGFEDIDLREYSADLNERDRFLKRYVGPLDGKSSLRLVDAVEACVAGRAQN